MRCLAMDGLVFACIEEDDRLSLRGVHDGGSHLGPEGDGES